MNLPQIWIVPEPGSICRNTMNPSITCKLATIPYNNSPAICNDKYLYKNARFLCISLSVRSKIQASFTRKTVSSGKLHKLHKQRECIVQGTVTVEVSHRLQWKTHLSGHIYTMFDGLLENRIFQRPFAN